MFERRYFIVAQNFHGTTLLSKLLNDHPEVVSLGDTYPSNRIDHICGCGENVSRLHHTGAMWLAIERALGAAVKGGIFYVALYNDQGWKSHIWWLIKYGYTKIPRMLRPFYVYFFGFLSKIVVLLKYILKLRPQVIIKNWLDKKNKRGMTHIRDMHDWIGGYPYEFVGFDVMKKYLMARGGEYWSGKNVFSLGCHEWVFRWPV